MSVVRGCGSRKTGGIYAECTLAKGGTPLDFALIDSPRSIDEMGVSKVGVTLYEIQGVWHILDWVGTQHYPTMPDFIEEARKFGVSRRLSKNLDFSKLTVASKLILIHEKAIVETLDFDNPCPCFRQHEKHVTHQEACIYHAYQALPSGNRVMPGFNWDNKHGEGKEGVKYRPGIFAAFPITDLVQVRDDSHLEKIAQVSGIPVKVVME